MNPFIRRVLFFLFFLSGFSSLIYQVVWTRLAFASFGIITPVLSVVLSVFMLGLALGSWLGGRQIATLTGVTGGSAIFFYGAAELFIGLGAFAVPKLFALGENLLLGSGETNSFRYLSLSAWVLAGSILPWCVCMGTTFPFMMAFIREREPGQENGFSFLYLANVLGAMAGTFLAAVVYIELLGFHHTLWIAAAGNFAIAFISLCLGLAAGRSRPRATEPARTGDPAVAAPASRRPPDRIITWMLFSTGFVAMAMEVVWTRSFTPVLKTQVYSFAMIVVAYLGATCLGSLAYRRQLRTNRPLSIANLTAALAVLALLPVLANDARLVVAIPESGEIHARSALLLLLAITPFCAVMGYLTPGLIDEFAHGRPKRAGQAYAINVFGCILGPLFACYFLLPFLGERYALILLGLPFLAFCLRLRRQYSARIARLLPAVLGLVLLWSLFGAQDFESRLRNHHQTEVRRDYAATVISYEDQTRYLLVNGIGMTTLSSITKFMAHLPLAFHQDPPRSALVICFGMGTSYRSAMSWNIDTTAVELVPGVTRAFGFYHADAARLMTATNGHIITDDGRRFLKRTARKFDVIIVDPPPPVNAAGSSLLYSKEFYDLAKEHLAPGGILQMWFPGNPDTDVCQAAIRSIYESFPNLRCFQSVQHWGIHMLASMSPIPALDADALAARMPPAAQRDLLEWAPVTNAPACLNAVLRREISVPRCLNPDLDVQVTDDEPYNEYFLLRILLPAQTGAPVNTP